MKKLFYFAFIFSSVAGLQAQEEAVCPKCQIIREENKKKVNPYKYYEDYQKDHPESRAQNNTKEADQTKRR